MGWVKIDRKIQSSDIWIDDEPFCKRAAWIDLILSANHVDRDVWVGTSTIKVLRGQFITSQDKLSKRWNWTRKRVRNYLSTLENLEMIKVDVRAKKYTTITLVKYGLYQDSCSELGQQEANERPTEGQQRNINKKDKKDKNDKNAAAYARKQTINLEEVNHYRLPSEMPIRTGEGDISEAIKVYERNIGPITPIIAEQMQVLLNEVGFSCYQRAVERACRNGARRYRYVEAVARGLASGVDYDAPRGNSCGDIANAFAKYLGGDGSDN